MVPKKKSRISQWGAAQLWYHSLKFRSDQYFKNYFSAVFGQSEGRVIIWYHSTKTGCGGGSPNRKHLQARYVCTSRRCVSAASFRLDAGKGAKQSFR